MFYIYEKSSTYIMGKMNTTTGVVRPDHRHCYKTMAAAKAAITRMSKRHRADMLESVNDPVFRYGIAEAGYFHKTIEKKRTVYSIFDEDKDSPLVEGVNVPGYMSPRSEAYWSM
tara:strand:- start:17 stop:358 length:342 start_codon:yes stop_codon:yes gene_type:complete